MRLVRSVALVALLVAGTLVTTPAASVLGPDCGAPWKPLHDALQRDDNVEGDAGDCAAQARDVNPSATATYHWATLDAVGDAGSVADLHDWFRVDLASKFGVGAWLMSNVSGDVAPYYTEGIVGKVPHVPFLMEIFTPDGQRLTADSCGPGVDLVVVEGPYIVHVTRATGADAVPCEPKVAYPADAGAPQPIHNYGFYNGCKPVCHLN